MVGSEGIPEFIPSDNMTCRVHSKVVVSPKMGPYHEAVAQQNGSCSHRYMAQQIEKTWTQWCESKRSHPEVPPFD
jgi:hypothetical protein